MTIDTGIPKRRVQDGTFRGGGQRCSLIYHLIYIMYNNEIGGLWLQKL